MMTKNFFKKTLGFQANESAAGNCDGNNESSNNSNEPIENHAEMNNESIDPKNQEEMNETQEINKKARIYNLIIVDESGSMCGLEHATVTGVNETINSIRGAQKEFADTQEHFLTIVTFDSNGTTKPVRTLIDRKPIAEVEDFRDYSPYGGTPLYDAMGQSITVLHNHIKDDDDASAVVTVLTDGYENASREWSGANLKVLIEKLTQEGWSFSYMGSSHDVKQVSFNLSINNVIEFSHDVQGTSNTWARESSAKHNYYRKMHEEYRRGRRHSKEEWIDRKRQMANEYYENRVTPNHIANLKEGEIFVFGSNPQGFHSGGAAKVAMDRFGAVWGQGEGLQGRSYALPTTCPIEQIAEAVQRFTQFASQHPELRFLVTRVGCGIAGRNVNDVAPLFKDCICLENVALPAEFWKILGLTM
jgi:hypothetical protein